MRTERIREMMKDEGLDMILISDPVTVDYITQVSVHPGERMFLLMIGKEGRPALIINELFPQESPDYIDRVVIKDTDDSIGIIAERLKGARKVGVDKAWPARFLLPLMKRTDSEFVLGSSLPDSLRAVKDESEKEKMRKVSHINDISIEELITEIEASDGQMTEVQAGERLLEIYRKNGADGFSFPPIIAYGANGADPHHENDDSVLKDGDSIIVDVGCALDGYMADMTRTYFYKSVSEESRKVYETVLEAQLKALAMIKPGVRYMDVDRTARDHITENGYGRYFTHRLGHGIGREVHEGDDVSSVNENTVKEGMCFSVEPGIYLPGKVGVRIEDLIIVTESGCEILNKVSKELRIIGK